MSVGHAKIEENGLSVKASLDFTSTKLSLEFLKRPKKKKRIFVCSKVVYQKERKKNDRKMILLAQSHQVRKKERKKIRKERERERKR